MRLTARSQCCQMTLMQSLPLPSLHVSALPHHTRRAESDCRLLAPRLSDDPDIDGTTQLSDSESKFDSAASTTWTETDVQAISPADATSRSVPDIRDPLCDTMPSVKCLLIPSDSKPR